MAFLDESIMATHGDQTVALISDGAVGQRSRKAWRRWGDRERGRLRVPSARGSARPHLEQIPHGLRKAHGVHGHTHSVGKSKNEADGTT